MFQDFKESYQKRLILSLVSNNTLGYRKNIQAKACRFE